MIDWDDSLFRAARWLFTRLFPDMCVISRLDREQLERSVAVEQEVTRLCHALACDQITPDGFAGEVSLLLVKRDLAEAFHQRRAKTEEMLQFLEFKSEGEES